MNLEATKIDRLSWIPKSNFSPRELKKLKSLLVVYKEDVEGNITPIKQYDENPDYLLVPRFVADNSNAIDCTTFQPIWFPEFIGELRPPQRIAASDYLAGLHNNRMGGIICMPCGSGKTCTAIYLMTQIKVRTLVLLHKADLMKQWYHDIEKFTGSNKIGWVRQNKQEFENYPVTLALYQTVRARREELAAKGFFDYFSMLTVDEVHHVPANTVCETVKLFNHRISCSLSATPRRKDGTEDLMFNLLGPVVAKPKVERQTGTYAQLMLGTPIPKKIQYSYATVINIIVKNNKRNLRIASDVYRASKKGRKILVLSDRVKHLKMLKGLVSNKFLADKKAPDIGLYIGEMKQNELDISKKSAIILATYGMAGEGSDIPDCDTLFLTTPRSDIEQVIGRIQRIHTDKKPLFVYDIVDPASGLLRKMAKKRIKYYNQLGFSKYKGE